MSLCMLYLAQVLSTVILPRMFWASENNAKLVFSEAGVLCACLYLYNITWLRQAAGSSWHGERDDISGRNDCPIINNHCLPPSRHNNNLCIYWTVVKQYAILQLEFGISFIVAFSAI